MNIGLITAILESMVRALPADAIRTGLDGLLDHVEDYVAKTPNKIDDAVAIPLMNALRAQLGITEVPGGKYADAPVASVDVNVTVKDETK